MPSRQERRRQRQTPKRPVGLQLEAASRDGKTVAIPATLIDFSEYGCGLQTPSPLSVGDQVTVKNLGFPGSTNRVSEKRARVAYCRLFDEGVYRSGLAFEEEPGPRQQSSNGQAQTAADSSLPDYYEILQVSSQADLDTIQRGYRMLAQRYHPDNAETGNDTRFRLVLQAYRTLSEPENRAAYDVKHKAAAALRWRIFGEPDDAGGFEDENKKRWGILSALYMKRKRDPEKPGVRLRDLEVLLGCPREHLQFSLWYLRGKAQVSAADSGCYEITPEGADALEAAGPDVLPKMPKLLEQPRANTYGKDFEQIEAFFRADRKLKGILAPHVGKFFRSDALLKLTSGKQRAEPTVKKTMRVLRMFLVWAKETGRIDKLPLPKDTAMGRSAKKEGGR